MQFLSPHTSTRSLASPRLALPSRGNAWMAWHGMVWYGVLVPYHRMCLVEGSLLQNCFGGYAWIFWYSCVLATAMQWCLRRKLGPILRKKGCLNGTRG